MVVDLVDLDSRLYVEICTNVWMMQLAHGSLVEDGSLKGGWMGVCAILAVCDLLLPESGDWPVVKTAFPRVACMLVVILNIYIAL